MKISVVMATYNGERYLQEQLDSLARQARLPDELVVTDDCSNDETVNILQEFAESAPFEVRIFRNDTNLGYAQNFARAIELSTGELIFLSDQDDVWFRDKIAVMEAYALKNPEAQVIMCDAALTDARLNDTGLTKLGQIRSAGLSDDSFVMGCCCAVRKNLLDICMPMPDGFGSHDGWIVSFATGLKRRHIIEETLQYYRRHSANSSQFIVNRTKRVSRLSVRLYRWRQSLFPRGSDAIGDAICRRELFIEGLENALLKAKVGWRDELSAMLAREKKKLLGLKRRKDIREKRLLSRIREAVKDLLAGEYRHYAGLKSAIRDILG